MERIGLYRITRQLGEGGMGIVYEASHDAIARRVAIKLLNRDCAHSPSVVQRFFNEAKATNLIDHPSLVQVSDLGLLPDGRPYIVMELLKGENLGQRMRRLGGRMPIAQTIQLGWQIAEALAAAHRAGIVHRDLKPDNIMLVRDPVAQSGERAKILDFGIAKLAQGGSLQTTRSVIMGTPRYMSPEQCRGAGEVDAKSDVYSLGVVLYEMLAGRPLFVGEGMGDLLIAHIMRDPVPLATYARDLPPALAQLIYRLLLKDRTQRPDMQQVADELARLGASRGSSLEGRLQLVPDGLSHELPTRVLSDPQGIAGLAVKPAVNSSRRKRIRRVLASSLVTTVLLIGSAVALHRSSTTVSAPLRSTSSSLQLPASAPMQVLRAGPVEQAVARGTVTATEEALDGAHPEDPPSAFLRATGKSEPKSKVVSAVPSGKAIGATGTESMPANLSERSRASKVPNKAPNGKSPSTDIVKKSASGGKGVYIDG